MQEGDFIKIPRFIFFEWGWYSSINTTRVFLHMMAKANYTEGNFQGTTVPRGSFISSIRNLAGETYLTVDEIRTALKKLEECGEVTKQSTNKFTLFTVVNYDLYQGTPQTKPKQKPSYSQATPNLFPTIKEEKESKKGRREEIDKKEVPKGTKKKELPVYYPNDEQLNSTFDDFVQMRKQIKKPMTDRAITLMINKLEKLSKAPFSDAMDNDLAIKILEQSIVKSWSDIYPLKEENSSKKDGTIDWSNV